MWRGLAWVSCHPVPGMTVDLITTKSQRNKFLRFLSLTSVCLEDGILMMALMSRVTGGLISQGKISFCSRMHTFFCHLRHDAQTDANI